MSSLARINAANRNGCRQIIKYFDLEKYTKASPEMVQAISALESVLAGNCKCGNAAPGRRFLGCGVHLSCEQCFEDKDTVMDRRGQCTVAGCREVVCWPCRPVQAFDAVQVAAKDAFQKLDRALELEEQKDVGEGARRRAAARGVGPVNEGGEMEVDPPAVDPAPEADPAPGGGAAPEADPAPEDDPVQLAPAAAAVNPKKRKTKADFPEEVWEQMQAEKKQKADGRQQVKLDAAKDEGREEARVFIDSARNGKLKYKRRVGYLNELLASKGVEAAEILAFVNAKEAEAAAEAEA